MTVIKLNENPDDNFLILTTDNSIRKNHLRMNDKFHELIQSTDIPIQIVCGTVTLTIEKTHSSTGSLLINKSNASDNTEIKTN